MGFPERVLFTSLCATLCKMVKFVARTRPFRNELLVEPGDRNSIANRPLHSTAKHRAAEITFPPRMQPPERREGRTGRRHNADLGSGQLVEEEINGGNPAVPGDDEIRSGVCWRIARAARYPWDPPAIAQFLGLGN
jgi:hypothetical protein